ncbi:5-hydroxyisourate hydrolase [Paramormyrops kingsleyae]|uniref:5-hydroxyisourate hydrolase n=1 Tax=Paramormyrops kingsleyae TaxID=1676925 RepID=A0A3B3Q8K6_9TELE|nr:5-hydroxyisourate hydrolase-like [Paramormyrops kingsleyae]XP_023646182.1 5-hydroxyisourate hydrolase-like [Paramormyrops kingsleyae]
MSSNRLKRIKDHILSENQCSGMATPEGSPLTTHVLNTAEGVPGSHMALSLHRLDTGLAVWSLLSMGITNDDGRCTGLITREAFTPGMYKMRFETGEYWEHRGQKCFYPYVEVVFTITDSTKKFHVPLLLSCFSYTTYRGS